MPKTAGGIMPLLTISAASGQPIFLQLYAGLRESILQGRIKPGSRLPSTRTLSAELGISRNTVLAAYEQLIAEGYLESRVGRGTAVTQAISEEILRPSKTRRAAQASKLMPEEVSRRMEALSGVPVQISPIGSGPVQPFRVGTPAIADFPFDLWRRTQSNCFSKIPYTEFDYGNAIGHPVLQRTIADYVQTARGVNCTSEQVIITTGSQQAIDMIGRILLDPGDSVWMENPGYLGARGALIAAGAKLIPVPVDEEGLKIDAGIRIHRKARIAYVSPSHQMPLGVNMSLTRRLELLSWASENRSWVIEDDYDSEFRYKQRPLCSLQGLDANGRVIYLGTFSKVLFPALRLGYMIVPGTLVDHIKSVQHFTIGHPSILNQLAVAQFIQDGHFERHIRRMRVLYAERQQILLHVAEKELKGMLSLQPAQTGMHLIGWLPKGIKDEPVSLRAAQEGIEAIPISVFYLGRPVRHGLLLGYAAFNEKQIEQGITGLRRALALGND